MFIKIGFLMGYVILYIINTCPHFGINKDGHIRMRRLMYFRTVSNALKDCINPNYNSFKFDLHFELCL